MALRLVKKADAFKSAQRTDAKSTKKRDEMRQLAKQIQREASRHVRNDGWKTKIDLNRKLEAQGQPREDTWQNSLTALGTSRDKRTTGMFQTARLVDLDAEDIWRGDDMAGRAVETVPNQIVRAGFEIQIKTEKETPASKEKRARLDFLRSGSGRKWWMTKIEALECGVDLKNAIAQKIREDLASDVFPPDSTAAEQDSGKEMSEAVNAQLDDLNVLDVVGEALKAERGYGGSAILVGIKDGVTDLTKPLDLDRIQSVDWLDVLTPLELIPFQWYDEATEKNYGQPELYWMQRISVGNIGATTRIPIHESRLIRFPGLVVSRRQLREHWGWGDSVLVRMIEVLRDFQTTWQGASVLMSDFAQAVFSMEGLAESFASGDPTDQNLLATRATAMDLGRSIARAIIIDKEEKFERQSTPISGLAEMMDRFCNRLAAAAHMPVTLLMGQAPAGLNATGDSDIRSWYDNVGANRERQLKPRLTQLMKMLFAAKRGPTKGLEPESWSWKFGSLWQATELEESQRRLAIAQADQIYLAAQVLIPEEVAISRFGGDAYSAETHLDRDVRQSFDDKAAQEAETQAAQIQAESEAKVAGLKAAPKGMPPRGGGAPPGGGTPKPSPQPKPQPKPQPAPAKSDSGEDPSDYAVRLRSNATDATQRAVEAKPRSVDLERSAATAHQEASRAFAAAIPTASTESAAKDAQLGADRHAAQAEAHSRSAAAIAAGEWSRSRALSETERSIAHEHAGELHKAAAGAHVAATTFSASQARGGEVSDPHQLSAMFHSMQAFGHRGAAGVDRGEGGLWSARPKPFKLASRPADGKTDEVGNHTLPWLPDGSMPGGLGVPRSEMPQIVSDVLPEFLKGLESNGASVRSGGSMPVGKLKPMQALIRPEKVEEMLAKFPPETLRKPIVVSSDGYILDGHHRWAALRLKGPDEEIQTHEVGMPARALLEAARNFPKVEYRDAYNPDQPRDAGGRWGEGGGPKATAKKLPDAPERYFHEPKGSERVKVSSLKTAHNSTPERMASAAEKMAAAHNGTGDKRAPLSVKEMEGGVLSVVDGNTTTAVAREQGWSHVVANVERFTTGKDELKELDRIKYERLPAEKEAPLPAGHTHDEHEAIAEKAIAQHAAQKDAVVARLAEIASATPGINKEDLHVKGRVKETKSALNKLREKPQYGDASKLQDITGMRVIAGTTEDVNRISDAIHANYEVLEGGRGSKEDYIAHPKEGTGYRSVHFIVKTDAGPAEIQVRTANQNAHADWAHNVYKPLDRAQERLARDERVGKLVNEVAEHFNRVDRGIESTMPHIPSAVRLVFGTPSNPRALKKTSQ